MIKRIYIGTIGYVTLISLLVLNGFGGWITFFGGADNHNKVPIVPVFLLMLVILMTYGLFKYDYHDELLRDKLGDRRARSIRVEQIAMIAAVSSLLLILS
jgi:hypothetical protein